MMGIYKIENKVNGKVYIGQSMDIERRWKEHMDDLNSNTHINWKLQKDWNTYGGNAFDFTVESIIKDDREHSKKAICIECYLIYLENTYMNKYDAILNGYNIENTLYEVINNNKLLKTEKKRWAGTITYLKNIIKSNGECFYKDGIGKNKDYKKILTDCEIAKIIKKINNYEILDVVRLTDFLVDVGMARAITSKIKTFIGIEEKNVEIDFGNGFYYVKDNEYEDNVYYKLCISNKAKQHIINYVLHDRSILLIQRCDREKVLNRMKRSRS